MQRFINFVVRYKEYITFVSLVIICFSLISMGNIGQIGGYRTIVIGSVGWLQKIFSWLPNPGATLSENKSIRELNLQLSGEVTRMRKALIENKRLRDMIALKEKTEIPLMAADVVGRSTVEMRSYITLNKGKDDGIDPGMAVRTDAGLVGVVVGVSNHYTLVELIVNRNTRIAVQVQRNGINGIMIWEGGRYLSIKNIPESFDVKAGDVVMTSNYSNKYPMDIPVGKIIKADRDPTSLFMKIEVEPFANFSSLEQVFIIEKLADREKIELLKQLDERLSARQK